MPHIICGRCQKSDFLHNFAWNRYRIYYPPADYSIRVVNAQKRNQTKRTKTEGIGKNSDQFLIRKLVCILFGTFKTFKRFRRSAF